MEGNNDSMTSEIMTNLMILLVACENNEIETTYLMEVSKNFLVLYNSFTRSIGLLFSYRGLQKFLTYLPADTHIDLFMVSTQRSVFVLF